MRTMTKTIVHFDALNDAAKEKAREWYREGDDMPMLKSHLENLTKEALEARGYKASDDHVQVFYDLSYSQGSHFYFTGSIVKDGIEYTIKQQGPGYTTYITTTNAEGEEIDAPQTVADDVAAISKEMKQRGYDEIEYERSAENVDETIRANEYTFTLEGVRMDADHAGPDRIPLVDVYNMTSPRGNREVPNQFIITTEDGRYFKSYRSIIAFIPKAYGAKTVLDERYWDYSTTTGQYRNQFLNEGIEETRRKIKAGEYILADLNTGK